MRLESRIKALAALVALEIFTAVGALFGGGLLASDPTGKALGMSTELLRSSPFDSYYVPGLVLLVVVGGSMAAAALLHLLRRRIAATVSLGAGAILVGWIAVQLAMIGFVMWIQGAMLAVGVAVAALSRIVPTPRRS